MPTKVPPRGDSGPGEHEAAGAAPRRRGGAVRLPKRGQERVSVRALATENARVIAGYTRHVVQRNVHLATRLGRVLVRAGVIATLAPPKAVAGVVPRWGRTSRPSV